MSEAFARLNAQWEHVYNELLEDYAAVHEQLRTRPAYSDNDFVRWQLDREEDKKKIKELEDKYNQALSEIAYWQRAATQDSRNL